MTAVAQLTVPLLSVTSPMQGRVLAETTGHINGIPLRVTVSANEIYISWVDRSGPAFAIELDPLVKEAANQIEILLGRKGGEANDLPRDR